jgi:hypothetical protein
MIGTGASLSEAKYNKSIDKVKKGDIIHRKQLGNIG